MLDYRLGINGVDVEVNLDVFLLKEDQESG